MLQRKLFVFLLFYLIATTTDHIEPSSILKILDCFIVNLFVLACVYTFWTIEKSKQLRILMSSLNIIINSDNYIVPSCGLPSRKHTSNSQCIYYIFTICSFVDLNKRDTLYSIFNNVREDISNLGQ